MGDFFGEELRGSRFERVDLSGSEFRASDLSATRFHGVDIGPLVNTELDRRYPDRAKMRPTDAAGFREAWDVLARIHRWVTGFGVP